MKKCNGKHSINELAIFGGLPTFFEPIHVGRPNIGNREQFLTRVNNALDRRWLTNDGPYVQELEQRLAAELGVKHCVTICNGTVALEIAIQAAGLSGEVIVPAMTFIATAHALQWQQITPVFCDVAPNSHNIDPHQIETLITPRTTGIIGVHLWGHPCQTDALAQIAQQYQLKLLYDAAHAFGCSHQGRMIGNFGDAEVFSFHATKFFNTLEGGAIVTNNDQLAKKARLMRNFGFAGYDNVAYIGTNGKMNEISAAMGLTLLDDIETPININQRNYHYYRQQLADTPGITFATYDEAEQTNYQYIVLEIDDSITGISRNQIMEILWAENIRARRYFYPGCHRMEPYRSCYPTPKQKLSETETLVERILVLPTGTAVELADLEKICYIIKLAIAHSGAIQTKFEEHFDSALHLRTI